MAAQTKRLVTYSVTVIDGRAQKQKKTLAQSPLEDLNMTPRPVYRFLVFNGAKVDYKIEPNNTIPMYNTNNSRIT